MVQNDTNDCEESEYYILTRKRKGAKNAGSCRLSPETCKHHKVLLDYSMLDLPFAGCEPAKSWKQPSLLLQYQAYKLHQELFKVYPQYRIDGCRNVWISKPSYNARGVGIYLINSLKDVISAGRKAQSHRIIQKYIERPLLLQLEVPSVDGKIKFENRKFDIRQWVLVTSYEPLCVYLFSSAYCRVCGSEFSLDSIDDNFRHISNYTVQKRNKRVENIKTDLCLSSAQFEEYIQKHIDENFTWSSNMFPKLKTIAIETLKSVQNLSLIHI